MSSFKIALPKGSLYKNTVKYLSKMGIAIAREGRNFQLDISGTELFDMAWVLRPEDIPLAVDRGIVDCGITGWDFVVESGLEERLYKVIELNYSKKTDKPVDIVVFGKGNSIIDREKIVVSAEYVNLAKIVFKKANVFFSSGMTEAKVAAGLSDYGVGVTETGSSLKDNDLNIIRVILTSPVVVITKNTIPEINSFGRLLAGTIKAEKYQLIKMNVTDDIKRKVITALPALKSPTVNQLADGSFAVETVVEIKKNPQRETDSLADLIMNLEDIGATGIVTLNINYVSDK